MCKECGCEEGLKLVCPVCSGRMVLIDGKAVCTVCAAERDPHTVAHTHGEQSPHVHDHEQAHSHDHDHEHPHHHHASPAQGVPEELAKLRVLLPYWQEQNHDHLRELRAWTALARALGQAEASALLEDALRQLEAGDRQLVAALAALGC